MPKQTALEDLPVAQGRAATRRCLTCRKTKPLGAYAGNARKCQMCASRGVQRSYERVCIVCGGAFESPAPHALLCSTPCRRERAAELARDRRARGHNADDEDNDP
jgi:hypothetical protein